MRRGLHTGVLLLAALVLAGCEIDAGPAAPSSPRERLQTACASFDALHAATLVDRRKASLLGSATKPREAYARSLEHLAARGEMTLERMAAVPAPTGRAAAVARLLTAFRAAHVSGPRRLAALARAPDSPLTQVRITAAFGAIDHRQTALRSAARSARVPLCATTADVVTAPTASPTPAPATRGRRTGSVSLHAGSLGWIALLTGLGGVIGYRTRALRTGAALGALGILGLVLTFGLGDRLFDDVARCDGCDPISAIVSAIGATYTTLYLISAALIVTSIMAGLGVGIAAGALFRGVRAPP